MLVTLMAITLITLIIRVIGAPLVATTLRLSRNVSHHVYMCVSHL